LLVGDVVVVVVAANEWQNGKAAATATSKNKSG
jgi:hypothetical protein